MEPITSFFGDYRFLSNFWPCKVTLDGISYRSVEHAYVAAKSLDPFMRMGIAAVPEASQVKRFGRKLILRPDWDEVRLPIMENLIDQKFNDVRLGMQLLATANAELVEGNTWGDVFWGICKGVGENRLGKLLMAKRLQLCVHDSLDNATVNGFDPLRFTVDENVDSLQTYDAVCDSLEADVIRPHVESFFRKHGKGYFAKDGTLMDAFGNRSIFDDVDQ